MQMNLFIFLIIVLVLVLVVFIALNVLYKRTNSYNNYIWQIKHIKEITPGIELVNLGSGYSKFGFSYNHLPLKGFNLGYGPQFFHYTDKFLKQFSRYFSPKCIVIIGLPDLVFANTGKNYIGGNELYYYLLDKKYIDNYSVIKKISTVNFPLLANPFGIRRIVWDTKKDETFDLEINPYDREGAISQAKERVNSWCRDFKLSDTISDNISNELNETFNQTIIQLENMIKFCLDNDFRPVLVVPPVSKEMGDNLSNPFLEKVLISNIRKANTHKVPFFDYSRDDRFQDYQLYVNSDFLNKKGRVLFTNVVLNDLKQIGYL